MRILVEVFGAREGGGKWFTGTLIQEIAEQNPHWHLLVFYAHQSFMKGYLRRPNIELRYVPQAIGYCQRIFWQQWKLRRLIKREKIELIFSPTNIGMFKPPVPQVTVQRNAHHVVPKVKKAEGGQWLRRRIQLLGTLASIKSSTENIFVSNYMIELTKRWIKPDYEHWHVVHNAINKKRFEADSERIVGYKYLLNVGALSPHKNVDTLIKAFKIVCKRYPQEIKLILAGPGCKLKHKVAGTWERYLYDLVDSQGMREKVVFMGVVEGNQLASLYKYAEICVVPSLLESFGIVAAEALCCDSPCIVSDIPVFHEVYGDAVLYCDPYSPADIADVIVRLLEDKFLRQKLTETGKSLLANYDISVIAQKYVEIIKRAVLRTGGLT